MAQKEFTQIYPNPGWVEHDPMEIFPHSFLAKEAMAKMGIDADEISATGITNQRETAMIWNKNTGQPVYNAIVWHRRTSDIIDELKEKVRALYQRTIGLIPDAYFSGTKIKWILDNVPEARKEAEKGNLLFGNGRHMVNMESD